MTSAPAMAYRPDIDGLRAVAVVPVILYHMGIEPVSGGYVGVDIFFVISGYLITGILAGEIRKNDFSIARFYERRVRRIFPALFAVLAATTTAGAVLLLPREFNDLGNSLAAATLFYSNYHFMAGMGYFAAPAENEPLLHTWSLAVEEQFYIGFPLLLYGLSRRLGERLGLMLAALLLASFGYGVVLVGMDADSAFYSTPARAWELMLGALLAVTPARRPIAPWLAQALTVGGASAILSAVLFFSPATAFPGVAALLPCVGAAVLIYVGGANATGASRILSLPPVRLVGLVSYSLYLWHWPVLVFHRLVFMREPDGMEKLVLLLLVGTLAWLSWRFVETPFRRRRVLGERAPLFSAAGAAMLVTLAVGISLAVTDGIPGRFSPEIARVLAAEADRAPLTGCTSSGTRGGGDLRLCEIGAATSEPARFVVWGDSHAEAMLPAIAESAQRAGIKGVYAGRDGCPPLMGVRQVGPDYEDCDRHGAALLEHLAAHREIGMVLLVSRWAVYASGTPYGHARGGLVYIRDSATATLSLGENLRVFREGFDGTIRALHARSVRVVVVEQVPETERNVPQSVARAMLFGGPLELEPARADYAARQAPLSALLAEFPPEFVVQPADRMCDALFCAVMDAGVPIYRDSNHLTATYARTLAPLFDAALASARSGAVAHTVAGEPAPAQRPAE